MSKKGKFITFEGIDGAGKSTHIAVIETLLLAKGYHVICTREPGGTSVGEKLRELLLHEPMSLETETLLMFAARQEHLKTVIEPALARGDWVLCDRFSDATYAYQGGGRGLPKDKFLKIEQWVHAHLEPDLTFLFDLPPSVASHRIQAQGRSLDRFEQEKADFHQRVRQAYLERAAENKQRFCIINAEQGQDLIRKQLEEMVIAKCL